MVLTQKNLKQQLDFFHPSFHSITPEGFNSRLTFLLQCTRQGPSIQKTADSPSNMAFGTPPVCVLKIGDFYHTKVVIDSVNISYDDNLWDLNPDGIGIQPMIATVDLNMKMVGGGKLIITTSGTTGAPKAILIDGDRLWSAGLAFLELHALKQSRLRFWNYLPMSYLGGLFNLALIPVASGGSFVVGEPFSGKTFLGFWQNIERYGVDALWMVPSIVRGLISLAERTKSLQPPPPIRNCFLGTASITLSEKTKFRNLFGIEMLENYGLTETTFLTSEKIEYLFFIDFE